MSINPSYFQELQDFAETKIGLLSVLCLIILIVDPILIKGLSLPWLFISVINLFLLTGFYLWWKRQRTIGVLRKRVNIILAFHAPRNSEKIRISLSNLRSSLINKLNKYEIINVRLKFLPSDIKIATKKEAQELIKKGYVGHTLMIWGDVMEFGDSVKCQNTNFTYELAFNKSTRTEASALELFSSDIAEKIRKMGWDLNLIKSDTFQIFTDNVNDIGMYIIFRTLLTVGEFDKSLELGESLIQEFSSSPSRDSLVSSIKMFVAKVYFLKTVEAFYKGDKEKTIYYIDKALENSSTQYLINIFAAMVYERYKGDTSSAKVFTRKAKYLASRKDRAHLFNEAYFCLKDKKFDTALAIYGKLNSDDAAEKEIVEVIVDLDLVYNETGLPEFLFAKAYIMLHWMEEELPNVAPMFEKFIEDTEGLYEYNSLRRVAKAKLEMISKKK